MNMWIYSFKIHVWNGVRIDNWIRHETKLKKKRDEI